MTWVALGLAILLEVAATSSLKAAGAGSNWAWVVVVLGYAASICLLVWIVQRLDVGVVYAIWSGLGTALIAWIGVVALGDALSPWKGLGIALIVGGVVVINLEGAH